MQRGSRAPPRMQDASQVPPLAGPCQRARRGGAAHLRKRPMCERCSGSSSKRSAPLYAALPPVTS